VAHNGIQRKVLAPTRHPLAGAQNLHRSQKSRVADPHQFNADPNPDLAFHFNADPDPDPTLRQSDGNLRPLVNRPSRAQL
jgi:hypothetical protein